MAGADCPLRLCDQGVAGISKDQKSVWFGSVRFGGLFFCSNASLEPQLRAEKRARLAVDALAHNASLGLGGISHASSKVYRASSKVYGSRD